MTTATTTDTIDALWAAFDESPDDLTRLGIIADAYRDVGNDKFADCLEWCRDNGITPGHWWHDSDMSWGNGYGFVLSDRFHESVSYFVLIEKFYRYIDNYIDGQQIDTNQPTRSAAYRHLCQFWIGS